MPRFQFQAVVTGVMDAPSEEIVRATVAQQLTLSVNLASGTREMRVDVEPVAPVELLPDVQQPTAFEAEIGSGATT